MIKHPNGIAGLEGREPIGAALTIGIKGDNGAPIQRDRFHILNANAVMKEYGKSGNGTYSAPMRELHAAFGSFNAADAAKRKTIPARLAHATVKEMFEYRRHAGSGCKGIPAHPKKAPVCLGDGINAIRWDGKEYQPIPCPNDKCPFAQPGTGVGGKKAACGPFMRFLGRFDFDESKKLPAIPFKFTSQAWNTAAYFLGFFEKFERDCRLLGVEPERVPLFGMPVLLTLSEKTNKDAGTRYPVVSIQINGNADFITWIEMQMRRGAEVRQLASRAPLALSDMSDDETIAADVALVSGPLTVPATERE